MAARLIHFGVDDCHRLMVLRTAGYAVAECNSLAEFRTTLQANKNRDAVCIAEGDGVAPEIARSLARSQSAAPVILFRTSYGTIEETGFDLVVPTLTPPEIWLKEIQTLITRCQKLRASRRGLIESLRALRRDFAAAREKSQVERVRSRAEYQRSAAPPGGGPVDPSASSG